MRFLDSLGSLEMGENSVCQQSDIQIFGCFFYLIFCKIFFILYIFIVSRNIRKRISKTKRKFQKMFDKFLTTCYNYIVS